VIANMVDLPYVAVIAVIVLIGGSQLPKLARNLGMAGKEFRKAQQEAQDQERAKAKSAPAPPPPLPLGPVAPALASPLSEESVTISKSELDELLRAREEQVGREATGTND
jgi:sec-independent protein translocase protein TatA